MKQRQITRRKDPFIALQSLVEMSKKYLEDLERNDFIEEPFNPLGKSIKFSRF